VRRYLTNHRLIITVSLLLAFVAVITFIIPVTADSPDQTWLSAESSGPLTIRSASQLGGPSGAQLSRAPAIPYPPYPPYPVPPYPPQPQPPISGTVRISGTVWVWPYPFPWWCYWPTPAAPSGPPGLPTPVPPTPLPSPTPGGPGSGEKYEVCPQIVNKVPNQVQADALAQPWAVYGYGVRQNPNVPEHPLWNHYRTWLGIMNPNIPYNICTPVIWKAGCPNG
jgi:hypothetical protein